jgi:Orsellinic acid/F9775 biosynthesis cluster protein D
MSELAELTDWFVYNEQFDLICSPCGVVIMPGNGRGLKGHLDSRHHSKAKQFPLSTSKRRELLKLHEHRTLNPEPRSPEPDSPRIPCLPVLDGYFCLECPYICSALGTIEYHARKFHRWSSKKQDSSLPPELPLSSLMHRHREVE